LEDKVEIAMGNVYVLGGAQTDFERNWTKEGKNVVALLKEAINDALEDTAISFDDIVKFNRENRVACYVGNSIAEKYINQGHLGALLTEVNPAFYGVPSARYEAGSASSAVALDAAITKIALGDYDLAIVIGWELMKTVTSKACGEILGREAYYEKEGRNISFPMPKLFGKLADETVEKFNINRKRYFDALARISTLNYSNAKRNPLAQTRKWFMDYEQANNRGTETNALIGGVLAASDCAQITDGAAVVVLASEKLIKALGREDAPIVKGYGHRVAPMMFDEKVAENACSTYGLPWTRQAVVDEYRRSKLSVDDIDVFETHDCFTSAEYAAISAFGITEPGKEYEAVENNVIAFHGEKPINPSGGLIGCGHPAGASGCRMFLDIYKQVSGKAGGYQVIKNGKIPRNGMMLNIGGSATTNYVYIVGR
jgi:acetyl-CoA C-acetyltransferase